MNTKLNYVLNEYGKSHQNNLNQKIHKICVPLILLSILGMLSRIPFSVNLSYVFVFIALFYYIQFKNISVYFVLLIQLIPMFLLIHFLQSENYLFWLGLFIVAWIGQFIGHKIEGKKPSFFQDIAFLLIGPIWVFKKFIK